MKPLKIMLVILVLSMLVVPMLSCGSESDEGELPESDIATVQRGDITIDITAAGNLALAHTEDLAVELFYGQSGTTGTKGTIGEVLVEAGDTVEEGQLLVTVDKDEWNDQLAALEDQVMAKERDLVQAQVNLLTAEQNLKNARDNEAAKELALLNAQISLDEAQYDLNTGITAIDFEAISAALNKAKTWYEHVEEQLQDATDNIDDVVLKLENAKEDLDIAQAEYDNVLAGYDSHQVAIKKKELEAAEMSLASAEEDLADVIQDVALKELQVTLTEGKITDAEKALVDAKEDLEEAISKSPEIKAPFNGFITEVNVEGGDEVLDGTVAVQIADPSKFEADILVSEMDILQIKLGGEAWVEVDAMQGLSLPATVTRIAPTATISSGVVNYEVKVEVQSLEAVARERQEAGQEAREAAMEAIARGELPEGLKRAVEAGRLTQEQAEEIIKQGPPSGMGPPPGMELPPGVGESSGQEAPATSQVPSMVPEDFQLREGLTVTVTIIVEEKADVLLVSNAAITTEGIQSYVQVVAADGTTEKRAIQTGLTDYQFTEVTEGLTEGEQVIVPQGTITTSTTTSPRPPRMGFFGPR